MTSALDARVHDLLRLASPGALQWDGQAPPWSPAAIAAAPWVVVRRASACDGRLPVGLRGALRSQRAAAWLDPQAACARLGPSELRGRAARLEARRAALGAFRALAQLEAAWRDSGPRDWGPGGSVGFELASGCTAVGPHSDLDVVVRCARAPARRRASAWLDALPRAAAARIDVLLEWPAGGAALAEFAAGGGYLLRSARGAVLRESRARA